MSDADRRMEDFHNAHGGVMRVCIIRHRDVPLLMFQAAAAGDIDNLVVLQSLAQWMQEAEHRKKSERLLCLDCDTTFHPRRMPDAFLVVSPFAAISGHAMVTGICRRCADRDDAALYPVAFNRLRSIYPDLTFAEAGRA